MATVLAEKSAEEASDEDVDELRVNISQDLDDEEIDSDDEELGDVIVDFTGLVKGATSFSVAEDAERVTSYHFTFFVGRLRRIVQFYVLALFT